MLNERREAFCWCFLIKLWWVPYLIKSSYVIRLRKCCPSSVSDSGSLHKLHENMSARAFPYWICDPEHKINTVWSAVQYNHFPEVSWCPNTTESPLQFSQQLEQFWKPKNIAGIQQFISGTKYLFKSLILKSIIFLNMNKIKPWHRILVFHQNNWEIPSNQPKTLRYFLRPWWFLNTVVESIKTTWKDG